MVVAMGMVVVGAVAWAVEAAVVGEIAIKMVMVAGMVGAGAMAMAMAISMAVATKIVQVKHEL